MCKTIPFFAVFLTGLVWLSPDIYAISDASGGTTGQSPQKVQREKIVIMKDGRTIEKDTAFVIGDGKGQTINRGNFIYKTDSMIVGPDKDKRVTIFINEKGEGANDGTTHTYTYTIGDTLQKDKLRKVIRIGDGKRNIIMQDSDGKAFGASTPTPFHTTSDGIRRVRQKSDPFAFDPSDPNIVSYHKKDVGKGLEKITIVRKKRGVPTK
jgi:hypothetical protein